MAPAAHASATTGRSCNCWAVFTIPDPTATGALVAVATSVPVVPAPSTRESPATSAAPARPVRYASRRLRSRAVTASAAARSSAHSRSGSGSASIAASIWSNPPGGGRRQAPADPGPAVRRPRHIKERRRRRRTSHSAPPIATRFVECRIGKARCPTATSRANNHEQPGTTSYRSHRKPDLRHPPGTYSHRKPTL